MKHCSVFSALCELSIVSIPDLYPFSYLTYIPAKFEAATSNGLYTVILFRGDAFSRKYIDRWSWP